MIKSISLLTRKPELTHEQFVKHWLEIHGPLAHAVPGLKRYVQSHIIDERTRPDIPTIVVTGDGSIQMNAQELATCTEHRIPVKVFIANNGYLGMVRQWQELFWDGRYSHVDTGQFPDFVKLAEAYGCTGIRLADKTSLVEDLKAVLATDGPVVVDVRVSREESVYPMIAPGAAAREMVG